MSFKKTDASFASTWRGREVHTTTTNHLPLMSLWLSADGKEVWIAQKTLALLSKAQMITQVCDLIERSAPGILILPREFALAFASLEGSDGPLKAISEAQLIQQYSDLAASAASRGDHAKAVDYFTAAATLLARVEADLETARSMMHVTASMVAASAA